MVGHGRHRINGFLIDSLRKQQKTTTTTAIETNTTLKFLIFISFLVFLFTPSEVLNEILQFETKYERSLKCSASASHLKELSLLLQRIYEKEKGEIPSPETFPTSIESIIFLSSQPLCCVDRGQSRIEKGKMLDRAWH